MASSSSTLERGLPVISKQPSISSSSSHSPSPSPCVVEFTAYLSSNPTTAVAVAAMKVLLSVVRHSKATTMMGLSDELKIAITQLKSCFPSSISLAAGCELFSRYVTRSSLDIPNFDECIQHLLERGEVFAELSKNSRQHIADLVDRFISDDKKILIHGYSRVVQSVLVHAAQQGKNFSVITTEGRPHCDGYTAAAALTAAGIPVTVILDSAVSYAMEGVDLVLTGAEAVVESGGIINKTGTYNIAIIAQALKRPFYVAAECYKFARLYPLNQNDLVETKEDQAALTSARGNTKEKVTDFIVAEAIKQHGDMKLPGPAPAASVLADRLTIDNPSCDYTPPQYITLLFTDLGILTPSAVSDELIKLYY